MANTANQFRNQFGNYFSSLTPKQKLTLSGGIVGIIALLLVMLVWMAHPNYEVLFSNLSQKDAGKIVENLKGKKIDYQLENGGTTILVPTDKVYDLRLSFAQEGLPESSSVGYEIFDQTNLGMTDFIQQVNYRRALEGELSRTIEQIESVDRARVHIVIPKEALFREDQKPPTASVILKLKGSSQPSTATVNAVCHLISSSVEGLAPENITILDTRGRLLSNNQNPNDLVTMSGTQLEFSRKVENYLAKKTQSMLDQIVGAGNAVVRVTAELNFTQVEKNMEEYDPDKTAVRSEEVMEESTPVTTGDANAVSSNSPAAKTSSTLTNYEVNKTVKRIIEGVGEVKRLSVAVLVNNRRQVTTDENGEKQIQYIPRTPKEMNMLTDLARTAVGLQSERGDQISVVNVDFSIPTMGDELLEPEGTNLWDDWYDLIEKVFLLLAIVAAMLIMRSLFSQVRNRNDEIQQKIKAFKMETGYPELPSPEGAAPGSREGQPTREEMLVAEDFFKSANVKDPLTQNLHSYIKEKPGETANLLKVWLTEDEKEEQ